MNKEKEIKQMLNITSKKELDNQLKLMKKELRKIRRKKRYQVVAWGVSVVVNRKIYKEVYKSLKRGGGIDE